MFAVCVTFVIKPGARDRFMPLMLSQAANSLEREEGCRQFDVCTSADNLDEVFLYEIYDNPAAFQAHLETGHYRSFDQEVGGLIEEKIVRTYGNVSR